MLIRKNILPRRLLDWACFLLIAIFLPIIFLFDLAVVLPVYHEPGTFMHNFTLVISCFLIINIQGNMVAAMMVDTSVNSIQSLQPPDDAETSGWRMCKKCQKLAPPRSWHCVTCGVCILKRDHHCLFTGCCIGHRNQRYFLLFVFYLFVGSTYAFVYNTLYLSAMIQRISNSWLILMKFLCPFIMMLSRQWDDVYIIFYHLNIVALVFSLWLLVYHMPMMLRGIVCHEKGKPTAQYNLGWRSNLASVFGKRMWLAFVWPLAKSELPGDGVEWSLQTSDGVDKNK